MKLNEKLISYIQITITSLITLGYWIFFPEFIAEPTNSMFFVGLGGFAIHGSLIALIIYHIFYVKKQ